MLQLKMIKQKLPLPHIHMTIWAISSLLKARKIQPLIIYDEAGRTLCVTQYAETIGAFNTPAHVSRLVSYIKSDDKL